MQMACGMLLYDEAQLGRGRHGIPTARFGCLLEVSLRRVVGKLTGGHSGNFPDCSTSLTPQNASRCRGAGSATPAYSARLPADPAGQILWLVLSSFSAICSNRFRLVFVGIALAIRRYDRAKFARAAAVSNLASSLTFAMRFLLLDAARTLPRRVRSAAAGA